MARLDFGSAVAAGCRCVFGSWIFLRLAALPFLLSVATLVLQGVAVPNAPDDIADQRFGVGRPNA